jgi:hypothetical protein
LEGARERRTLIRDGTSGIHVFIIADKNLRYQQNLSGRRVAIVELWTNHRPTLERCFSHIAQAVAGAMPATYVVVSAP